MKPIRIDACYGFKAINPEATCKIETYKIPWYKSIWYSITYYAPYLIIFLIGFIGVLAILLLFSYIASKL